MSNQGQERPGGAVVRAVLFEVLNVCFTLKFRLLRSWLRIRVCRWNTLLLAIDLCSSLTQRQRAGRAWLFASFLFSADLFYILPSLTNHSSTC